MKALGGDKKKKSGKLNFIVPARQGAALTDTCNEELIQKLINGEYPL
jgi:3-dehydroquinate synthetase